MHLRSLYYRIRVGKARAFSYFFDRIAWLNFLGAWHAEFLTARPDLSPAQVDRTDDSVTILIDDVLANLRDPEVEKRRKAVEKALRKAWSWAPT